MKSVYLALCLFVIPASAGAHAIVIDSSPAKGAVLSAPPERITLSFNARIEPALTRVALKDREGKEIPVTRAQNPSADRVVILLPPLAPGVYLVHYKVLASDGHVTEGTLHFTVLTP